MKEYKVVKIDSLVSNRSTIIKIEVSSLGKCGLGEFKNTFIFDSQDGFTKMVYVKPTNEKLVIDFLDKSGIAQ